ncbi:MAG: hypothetical protein AB1486_31945, partial [Planctomycetota bacterium]
MQRTRYGFERSGRRVGFLGAIALGLVAGLVVPLLAAQDRPSGGRAAGGKDETWLAIQAGRVITVSGKEIENGIILLRGGKIEAVGAQVDLPEGTRRLDARKLTVMPGLVHPYTRYSRPSYGRSGVKANLRAADELDFGPKDLEPLVQAGFTTIGLYPAGSGIPGQAVVLKTSGPEGLPAVAAETSFIRVTMRSLPGDKVNLRKALEDAKKEIEKIEKARKEWEEQQKKA